MARPTVTLGCDSESRPDSWSLVVVSSPDSRFPRWRRVALDRDLTLGREPGRGGLVLDDGAVSRKHVRFVRHSQHSIVELVDCDSKNGCFVNALRTSRRYLEPGDVVRVGETLFVVSAEDDAGEAADPLPEIVGRASTIVEMKGELVRIAPGSLPVLVLGETGTGKELVAKAVHRLSGRTGEFVPVNCAAIPEHLFESTFFGHRRGAFTGATEDSKGLLTKADGGTLLLDEVGELQAPAQAKLLRFLEDGMVRRVGDTRDVQVEVRIVASTNSDLHAEEARGRFRADLLARLEGFPVKLPALQDRRLDVPLLLDHFAQERGVQKVAVEPDALEALMAWEWKRNVRGLRTLVLRWCESVGEAGDSARSLCISTKHLPDEMTDGIKNRRKAPIPPPLEVEDRPSEAELARVLRDHDFNIGRVAEFYGKHRKQIYRWMERYGIAQDDSE